MAETASKPGCIESGPRIHPILPAFFSLKPAFPLNYPFGSLSLPHACDSRQAGQPSDSPAIPALLPQLGHRCRRSFLAIPLPLLLSFSPLLPMGLITHHQGNPHRRMSLFLETSVKAPNSPSLHPQLRSGTKLHILDAPTWWHCPSP